MNYYRLLTKFTGIRKLFVRFAVRKPLHKFESKRYRRERNNIFKLLEVRVGKGDFTDTKQVETGICTLCHVLHGIQKQQRLFRVKLFKVIN
jgi:hypothetical protein